jgi:hypothetical protein
MCVLRFIGAAVIGLSTLSLLSDDAWYTPYVALMNVANVIALIGVWQMKKWGGYSYILLSVTQIIVGGLVNKSECSRFNR